MHLAQHQAGRLLANQRTRRSEAQHIAVGKAQRPATGLPGAH